jgi:hypothetical protein
MEQQVCATINNDFNEALRKIVRTPIEFNAYQKGLLGRIETKDGAQIASYIPFMFPHSPVVCVCGTFVDKPVPSSMFVKNVRVGLRQKLFFLPYTALPTFSVKEVYKNKSSWSLILERLNQDEKLRSLIKELPTETSVGVSAKKDFTGNITSITSQVFKVDDKDNNLNTVCQCIPFKDRTLVTTRHMMEKQGLPKKWKRIETAVSAIIRIREHIIDYGYNQPATGNVPQAWAFSIAEFLK